MRLLSLGRVALWVLAGVLIHGVGGRSSHAAEPAAEFVLIAPPEFQVFGNAVELGKVGGKALEDAGCTVVNSGLESHDTFTAKVEASVKEKSPSICAYSIEATDKNGAPIYAVPRTVEDAICSLPWLKAEIERHLRVACDIAKAAVTRRMLSARPEGSVDAQADGVVAPTRDAPISTARAYTGWGLVAGGALVTLLGTQLWAADGDSLGADRQADTTGGPVIFSIGVGTAIAGALVLAGVL